MARTPSWREVANVLAERMSYHDRCGHHPESQADSGCPFCADRAAYRMWERKSGQTFVTREVPGETVDLRDLIRPTDSDGR